MGDNLSNSVVNKYLQSWDVPNVFVLGASVVEAVLDAREQYQRAMKN